MSKDPFQILADEITLIRSEIERLQRTSLDKDEAKALHQIVAKSVADIQKTGPGIQQGIENQLREAMHTIGHRATSAAHDAAERAVAQSHDASIKAAEKLLEDAERARRYAWRTFGNFWAWMIASGAVCACVAVLGTVALDGWSERAAIRTYGKLECNIRGGSEIRLNTGGTVCGFDMPE